jgi:hypothetical protein
VDEPASLFDVPVLAALSTSLMPPRRQLADTSFYDITPRFSPLPVRTLRLHTNCAGTNHRHSSAREGRNRLKDRAKTVGISANWAGTPIASHASQRKDIYWKAPDEQAWHNLDCAMEP